LTTYIASTCAHSLVIFIISLISLLTNTRPETWIINNYIIVIMLMYSGAIFVTLFIFLIMHVYLISKGKTTNEFIRKKEHNIFDEGCSQNWKNSFGC